jgi:hypothetical protein
VHGEACHVKLKKLRRMAVWFCYVPLSWDEIMVVEGNPSFSLHSLIIEVKIFVFVVGLNPGILAFFFYLITLKKLYFLYQEF